MPVKLTNAIETFDENNPRIKFKLWVISAGGKRSYLGFYPSLKRLAAGMAASSEGRANGARFEVHTWNPER